MRIASSDILSREYNDDTVTERYREFREAEGIPAHHHLYYDQRDELETGEWDRTGQRGAFLNLHGTQGVFDIHLHELRPGEETTTQHHLYQELVYVSQGQGATQIGRGDSAAVFEWQEGSHFFIPQGVPYKHVSYAEEEPSHLFAQTTLPQLLELVQYEEHIFDPPTDFWESSGLDDEFYSASGTLHNAKSDSEKAIWEANFVPDVLAFDKLQPKPNRGACKLVGFKMPRSSIWTHTAEFQKGQYMNAHHRAGPAAVYTILSGEGYSLMWQEDWEEIGKIEWSPGSIISYPHDCLHQHFNTGSDPARYLAWHTPDLGTLGDIDIYRANVPQNVIPYHEEDPIIREHYREALRESGQELRMPEECYTDPDYDMTQLVT